MRLITRILAGIGFLVVLSLGLSLCSALFFSGPSVPPSVVLTYDFARPLAENPQDDALLDAFKTPPMPLRYFVSALEAARKDDRVKGLLINVSSADLPAAMVEEVRAAIKRFGESGKFTAAWADNFAEMGSGNRTYWLASSCQKIWMQPLGTVGLTGSAIALPFARDLLDKLGIQADMHARYEFKGAASTLTERSLPAPLAANYRQLIDDQQSHLVNSIATDRQLKPATVRALMDKAPLLGKHAVEGKLLDGIGYWSEFKHATTPPDLHDTPTLDLSDYALAYEPPAHQGEKTSIALLMVDGAIVRRSTDSSPAGQGPTASAEELTEALKDLRKNPNLKAIVMRVNSPGGSVTASESILQALKEAKGDKIPLIVSMGDMAASGGYWISTAADYIVAEPSTLTGSIGVVGGKIIFGDLSKKLGISWAEMGTAANSTMWSPVAPFSGTALTALDASLDEVYNAFISRVAESRKLTPAALDKIARGRVWSGARAKSLGLVDELGGLTEAFAATRRLLKLPDNAPFIVSVYPRPESSAKRLVGLLRQFISAPHLPVLSEAQLQAWMRQSATTPAAQTLLYTGPR